MRMGSVIFLLGILFILQFSKLPSLHLFTFITCILLFFRQYCIARYLLWFFGGCLWTIYFSSALLEKRLLPELESKELDITGKVISLPETTHNTMRFNLGVTTLKVQDNMNMPVPKIARLSWHLPSNHINPGDELKLRVRLKRPHGFFNPGGFDYESWLFSEKISATGYVIHLYSITPAKRNTFSFNQNRSALKDKLDDFQFSYLNSSQLARALLIGDRSGMSDYHRNILFRTGTSHLIAISGLHIGLIAAFGFAVARWVWSCTVRGMYYCPANTFATIFSLLLAIGYAGLAGFSVPTQRALIMVSLALLIINAKQQFNKSYVLSCSLIIILLLNPLVILSPGIWLSYIAVSLILLAINSNILLRSQPRALMFIKIQFFIFFGMVPISIFGFNQLSLITILANSFSVPILGTIILPVLLIALSLSPINSNLSDSLLELGMVLLEFLWNGLEYISYIPDSFIFFSQPDTLVFLMSLVGVLIFLLFSKKSHRFLSLLVILPLLFQNNSKPEHGNFTLTVLDVGQGLAVSVQTENHTLLYDAGPSFNSGSSAGKLVVIPYLRDIGIKRLDSLIISHGDNDHIGGVRDILGTVNVVEVLGNKLYEFGQVPTETCYAGNHWVWDGINFEFLHPEFDTKLMGNNSSCVLKVGNDAQSVLIAGDIEFQAEDLIIDKYHNDLRARILLAPHHGSKTSSKSRFIRAVNPENVIFSTGYLNRFNLPNKDIITRYIRNGASVWNTATDGAIQIEYRGSSYEISTERQKRAKFWNGQVIK